MNVAFLTEIPFLGKFEPTSTNIRTEVAWMIALEATHYPLTEYSRVKDFDFVFIIWPKASLYLNAEGVPLQNNHPKKLLNTLCSTGEVENIIPVLQKHNKKVAFVQEGPGWLPDDYSLTEQLYHMKLLMQSDIIFCHNESDRKYYSHLLKPTYPIRSLLLEDTIKHIIPQPAKKVIIGGNFCRWYGGFKSYIAVKAVDSVGYEIWAPSMHNRQVGEESLINHLPYMQWSEWMKELSTFEIGVHLMPTVAAGTFSMNCAYFGIPAVGNRLLDTQINCFPELSVDVDDVYAAAHQIGRLIEDVDYRKAQGDYARERVRELFIKEPWLKYMNSILEDNIR